MEDLLVLITFHNGNTTPSAVTALKQSDFKNIISRRRTYFCFDNNVIFDESKNEFVEISYKNNQINFKLLYNNINKVGKNTI